MNMTNSRAAPSNRQLSRVSENGKPPSDWAERSGGSLISFGGDLEMGPVTPRQVPGIKGRMESNDNFFDSHENSEEI